jgi:hypothetical protein
LEKIIYVLWPSAGTDLDVHAAGLRSQLASQLAQAGVRSLKINVSDSAVAPAAKLRQTCTQPQIECLVQVWVDSAIRRFREPVDVAIAAQAPRYAAWLVTESQPLRNVKHPPQPGARTHGFAQIACLQRPPRLDYAAWLDVWHNYHTGVAIEAQSNFEYIQNVVVRPLTENAPAFDAIVEECFPPEAMSDPLAFFDAVGDQAKFQRNLDRMMDSVNRFIDMGRIDVAPTSQYVIF